MILACDVDCHVMWDALLMRENTADTMDGDRFDLLRRCDIPNTDVKTCAATLRKPTPMVRTI